MHLLSCNHITFVRSWQIIKNHLNCLQCKWICERSVQCGYICFNCMCKSIHTCICNLFNRESCNKVRINDCNIWCDVEVSQWIFHTSLIVCDN